MYLAVDPGKMNGWAIFDNEGNVKKWGQVTLNDFPQFLENLSPIPATIIYEDYTLFSHKAKQQSGSNMPASQVIGMVKAYAYRKSCKLIKQPASILTIAQKLTQVPMPKNHAGSHKVSAYNHGMYYLIKEGIAKTALQEQE